MTTPCPQGIENADGQNICYIIAVMQCLAAAQYRLYGASAPTHACG